MRTTITLDPDVAALVKRLMREREVTFKQAVNDAIRSGMTAGPKRKPFTFPTYDMGRPLVDTTKALRLAGELEDQEIVAKMRRGA